MYETAEKQTAVMNAQSIYDALEKEAFSEGRLKRIAAEFYADSHDLWEDDRSLPLQREAESLGGNQTDHGNGDGDLLQKCLPARREI